MAKTEAYQKQYQTLAENDFSGGVDYSSAENATPQGYLNQCDNVIPTYDGLLKKRPGYITYGGGLPIRVSRIEVVDSTHYRMYFPARVTPINARGTPILVTGRCSITGGDFPPGLSDSTAYYPVTEADPRRSVAPVTTDDILLPATESGLTSKAVIVTITESTFLSSNDNVFVFPQVTVDPLTFDVTATIANGTSATKYFFMQTIDLVNEGFFYYTASTGPATSWQYDAATHGLPSFNIVGKFYDNTGKEIVPDSFTIATNGTATATFSSNQTGFAVLANYPPTNFETVTVPSDGLEHFISFTVPSPWVSIVCYQELSGVKSQVFPDTIRIVDQGTTYRADITFVNTSGSSVTFYAFWATSSVSASEVVEAHNTILSPVGTADATPALNVYGIDHTTAYISGRERAGWVNHIDSYKSQGQQNLVSGLGGCLYATETRNSGTTFAAAMPTHYPFLRARITSAGDVSVGPAFVSTSLTSSRSRGYVQFSEVTAAGTAIADSIIWNGGSTLFLNINASDLTVVGTPVEFGTNDVLRDYITITQAPRNALNGSFPIRDIQYYSTNIVVEFEPNTPESMSLLDTDFNITGAAMEVGIFSDVIDFNSPVRCIPGDVLVSSVLPATESPYVLFTSGNDSASRILLNGFATNSLFPASLLVPFKRTDVKCLPLRLSGDSAPAPENLSIVDGDMLQVTGYTRQLRCIQAAPCAEDAVVVYGDGTEATVTLTNNNTGCYSVGTYIVLCYGPFAGQWQISSLVDDKVFKILCPVNNAGSPSVIAGATVEFDEFLPLIQDSEANTTSVRVPMRWRGLEGPLEDADVGSRQYPFYFPTAEYDNQPSVRSTMSAGNMYFVNGSDIPMKYDGSSISRAGLPRWQPLCQVIRDTSASSKIIYSGAYAAITSALTGTTLQVAVNAFVEGDTLVFLNAGAIEGRATVSSVSVGVTSTTLGLKAFTGTATNGGEARRVQYYRYYFRLNAVDANDNKIASASTGYNDCVVEFTESAQHKLKLIGLPAFDHLDFSRLELEVYRTTSTGVAPFRRLRNVDVSFNALEGYITVTDYTSDDAWGSYPLDIPFAGSELFPQVQPLPRAKYITSYDSRLVLANITSPQRARVLFAEPSNTNSTTSGFVGKKFTMRKDSTDTSVVTDMLNRVTFEGVSTGKTISNATFGAGNEVTLTLSTNLAATIPVGGWIYITAVSTTTRTRLMGWHQVSTEATSGTPTVKFKEVLDDAVTAFSGTLDAVAFYVATDPRDVPVFIGTDYGLQDFLGNTNSLTAVPFATALWARRLSTAVNATQRLVNTNLAGFETFRPWLLAGGGADFQAGEVLLEIVPHTETTAEIQLPSYADATEFRVYGNNVKRASGSSIGFLQGRFPARIVMSYREFPEVMDDPYTSTSDSDSIIDVNPDDGEEITGVIPMFGASATTNLAQRAGTLLCFKERSIYVVDTSTRSIQRLETNAIGCTLPYSIAAVRGGIAFASQSGIYRLNQALQLDFIGYKLGRGWIEGTNLSESGQALTYGHHYGREQQYKLSVAASGSVVPNQSWVYNYRREDKGQGFGGWCRYTNVPATCWANQGGEEFFGAASIGRVFQTRTLNEVSDFRDDALPVASTVVFRASDFGDAGIRKQCKHVVISFRNFVSSITGTSCFASTNLDTANWIEMQDFDQALSTSRSVDSLRFSTPAGRFVHLQIKVQNATIDEPMEVSGLAYRVLGLSDQRTREAKPE